MSDRLTIDVDASTLLQALDRMDDVVGAALKVVARDTAERIRDGARARLQAQTRGTGQTADAITIEDIPGGYKVFVNTPGNRPENLTIWLEFGTQKMTARPFMFAAARLEEGGHMRRVEAALREAVAEVQRG